MKKLTEIPNRLYLLFLIMILFAASIVSSLTLIQAHVRKTNEAKQQLGFVKEKIESVNSLHHSLLFSILSGKDETQNVFENTEKEIGNTFLQVKEILSTLSINKAIQRKAEVGSTVDKFNKAIADFSTANSILMISIKERGNSYSGIVSRWIRQAKDLDSAIQGNEMNVVVSFKQIRALQSEYLMTNNKNILDELNSRVLTLQGQLPMDDMVNSGKLDVFMQIASEIGSLNDQIGFSTHHGELYNYQQAYEYLVASYDSLLVSARKNLKRSTFLVYTMGYMGILLLLLAFIFLVYLVFERSTIHPFSAIRNFVSELSLGQFPKKPIEINVVDDPGGISNLLNILESGLRAKTVFARDLNLGKFANEFALLSKTDELGMELKKLQHNLISSSEEQLRNNEENAKRRYINEGLAKFANLLRLNSNDLTKLGDSFINELVKYLNAIQGGFFILDDGDKERPLLKLSAAFAYNRKKYLEKTIMMGEGLVGTCAIEKKIVHLTDIPKEYILITSGLGDAPPDNLLLVPVLHDEQIIGVLEIASLNIFKDYEITFAEEVANNLGSTIITTRVNQRTSELLSKSQQQAIEMAEQEEEMRQNLEELKATQEESIRREDEFRGIVDSLNLSVYILEYNLDGTIIFINDKFLVFLNKSAHEIIGKLHPFIFGINSVVDSKFWNRLNNLASTAIIEKLTIGKQEYQIKEHFSIIKNKDGLPIKVMNILTDIPYKIKS
jgi:PAS domain-containing protein